MTAPRKRTPRKAAKAAAAPRSQRDRLLRRPRPSTTYRVLVDPDGARQAERDQQRAEIFARQVLMREPPGTPASKRAQQMLDDAQAAVDACYEDIVLRALPTSGDVTWEAIAAEHPATAEQLAAAKVERDEAKKRGEEQPPLPSYADTFWPVILAACCENGMTEDDWAAFIAENVSDAEFAALKREVIGVNEMERSADPALPFGLMRMLSSS